MCTVALFSWNVRGIQSPLKCTMVTTILKKYSPAIYVLQDTHLVLETVSRMGFSWVGWAYHSTHTSYSRGVSVLVHCAVDFQMIDKLIDTEGRYVIILCKIHNLKCILAAIYVPPPFTTEVLRLILTYQLGHPDVPLIILGNLNCYMDPVLNKYPPPMASRTRARMALQKFTEEFGWLDPWRSRT